MKRLHKFLSLTPSERRLLVSATLLVGVVRLGLWLLPFPTLRHLLARITKATTELQNTDQTLIDRVVWAVTVASGYIPGVKCLTKALVTHALLTRCGYLIYLRIGVAKSEKGHLQAHAWVESQGRIVMGNLGDLSRYTPLPELKG